LAWIKVLHQTLEDTAVEGTSQQLAGKTTDDRWAMAMGCKEAGSIIPASVPPSAFQAFLRAVNRDLAIRR
jgi:hypothetical protein